MVFMSDREAEEVEDPVADGSLAERIFSAAFQTAPSNTVRRRRRRTSYRVEHLNEAATARYFAQLRRESSETRTRWRSGWDSNWQATL
jgi:hypothetical protein